MTIENKVIGWMPVEMLRLASLNAEYWFRVDQPESGEVADLYTADGLMVFGDLRVEGREAIKTFFSTRNGRMPVRTTRHVSTNLRVQPLGSDTVRVHSTVTVYSGFGTVPLDMCPPSSVVDFVDTCAQVDGQWAYSQRHGTAIFVGPGAAPFLLNQLPTGHPLRVTVP